MAKKIVDCLEHYFAGLGYNCAETTLRAANEAWEMGMDENAFRLMGGFGGGMGIRNVCGAVSGGVAALSYYYVRGTGHQSPLLMAKVRRFQELTAARLGAIDCAFLMPKYQTARESCLPTIRLVAAILDEVREMEMDEPLWLPRKLRPLQFEQALNGRCSRIDLRPSDVYAGGHIAGLRNLPPEALENAGLPRDLPVILCGDDVRAIARAAALLEAQGHKAIYYYDLSAWTGPLAAGRED